MASLKTISATRLMDVNMVLLTRVVAKIDHSEIPSDNIEMKFREIYGRKYEVDNIG